jgi:hypothetical protein
LQIACRATTVREGRADSEPWREALDEIAIFDLLTHERQSLIENPAREIHPVLNKALQFGTSCGDQAGGLRLEDDSERVGDNYSGGRAPR